MKRKMCPLKLHLSLKKIGISIKMKLNSFCVPDTCKHYLPRSRLGFFVVGTQNLGCQVLKGKGLGSICSNKIQTSQVKKWVDGGQVTFAICARMVKVRN
jgi:hypothetical protein